MTHAPRPRFTGWGLFLLSLILVVAIYWAGLQGSWLFDDYPNIVDNHAIQLHDASFSSLVGAALSSPASEFKRPLASLSFAANYLASGLDPYWMKLTNLVFHLLNGLLVFLLTRELTRSAYPSTEVRSGVIAALVAASWMLLPINLTAVLYVVQRMESMANLFVLLGLLGYVAGRHGMLASTCPASSERLGWTRLSAGSRGFILCLVSITVPTVLGILAKETAVMLPLYAFLIEWCLFEFAYSRDAVPVPASGTPAIERRDRRIIAMFVLVLAIPMVAGLAWLLPGVIKPEAWAARDFSLTTRLLSETRIIVDYIVWTLFPTPDALSFYHDDFPISTGLLAPWTTLASIAVLGALLGLMIWLRRRMPLAALGIALFFGCQLLTGTILPLELIYEHRNYFASFGLMLAVVPLLAVPRRKPFALLRHLALGGLLVCWTSLTAFTAYAWGNPLRLAEDLASRAPRSPRAQYELGRTYIINSHYDLQSPFTRLAYAPLEMAASLPDSSILPQQALIFMNSRMKLPIKDAWWDSMIAKLRARPPGVQDESSLNALTQCARERRCDLPPDRMTQAFTAALSHPDRSARILATYGDYAWNVLGKQQLGERMTEEAVKSSPNEPAYQITLIRMLATQGHKEAARAALQKLEELNVGGRLNETLDELRTLLDRPSGPH
jgi:hypothetical protein